MSADAGTVEYRVSGTLLPMPRRTAQLRSLPVPDAPICSCRNTALVQHAEDGDCPQFPGNRLSGQAPSWELVDPLGVRADTTHLVGLGPLLGADSGEMALHRSIGAHIAE